jgi:hypothetical protein
MTPDPRKLGEPRHQIRLDASSGRFRKKIKWWGDEVVANDKICRALYVRWRPVGKFHGLLLAMAACVVARGATRELPPLHRMDRRIVAVAPFALGDAREAWTQLMPEPRRPSDGLAAVMSMIECCCRPHLHAVLLRRHSMWTVSCVEGRERRTKRIGSPPLSPACSRSTVSVCRRLPATHSIPQKMLYFNL